MKTLLRNSNTFLGNSSWKYEENSLSSIDLKLTVFSKSVTGK